MDDVRAASPSHPELTTGRATSGAVAPTPADPTAVPAGPHPASAAAAPVAVDAAAPVHLDPASPLGRFIADVRRLFETETLTERLLAGIRDRLAGLLASPDCLDGFAIDREAFRSWKVHEDPDHLFAVHVSHQRRGRGRAVHDHGTLGWAVYGVWRGEVVQEIYERSDDGRQPGVAALRALPPARQGDGEVVVIPVDHAHVPRYESDSWVVVVRSRDIAKVWRNRYDVERGAVERFRGASGS